MAKIEVNDDFTGTVYQGWIQTGNDDTVYTDDSFSTIEEARDAAYDLISDSGIGGYKRSQLFDAGVCKFDWINGQAIGETEKRFSIHNGEFVDDSFEQWPLEEEEEETEEEEEGDDDAE